MSWVIMKYIDDPLRGRKSDDCRYWCHGGPPNLALGGDYYLDGRWVSMLYESTRFVTKDDAENALFLLAAIFPELLCGKAWAQEFDEEWFTPHPYLIGHIGVVQKSTSKRKA